MVGANESSRMIRLGGATADGEMEVMGFDPEERVKVVGKDAEGGKAQSGGKGRAAGAREKVKPRPRLILILRRQLRNARRGRKPPARRRPRARSLCIHWCVGTLCQAESFGPISVPAAHQRTAMLALDSRDPGALLAKSRRKTALWGETPPLPPLCQPAGIFRNSDNQVPR
jgi:hypothetical protein